MINEPRPERRCRSRGPTWTTSVSTLIVLIASLIVPSANIAAQTNPGHFSGTLYWSGSAQLDAQGPTWRLSFPEINSRLELAYERSMPDYTIRLRADARGTWGARYGFNSELDLGGSLRIREASVTTLNPAGEWILGRHQMLLPHTHDDFRRFGLLVGNASDHVDGLSWYRPVGPWELEAAVALIHVLRNPSTGQLDRGDVWTAVRAASQRRGPSWQLSYAPTLLLSDAVDSHGWSLPLRLDTHAHRFEGEIAQYNLTGTTLVPTGWYTAWVVRYAPLRKLALPLEAIEAASIPPYFLPHMGNFADRGGRLNWQPGEQGVAAQFAASIGRIEIAWRQIQSWNLAGNLSPSEMWELSWSPPTLPKPLSSADLRLAHHHDAWQLSLRLGVGYRF